MIAASRASIDSGLLPLTEVSVVTPNSRDLFCLFLKTLSGTTVVSAASAGNSVTTGQAEDAQMADAAGNISSEHESDEADHAMSESEEVVLDDDTIRLTMEFTGLPRHQVIDLLLHNDGDPDAVMAQLFP